MSTREPLTLLIAEEMERLRNEMAAFQRLLVSASGDKGGPLRADHAPPAGRTAVREAARDGGGGMRA
jgi:hypothetical protein